MSDGDKHTHTLSRMPSLSSHDLLLLIEPHIHQFTAQFVGLDASL